MHTEEVPPTMVVWFPWEAQRWRPRLSGHVPAIIVILVLFVGITCTYGQVAEMASLLAAITAAIMPQPRQVMTSYRT